MHLFFVKKRRLVWLSAVLLIGGLRVTSAPFRAAPSRPNILYIYADDLGYGELGCNGQQKIRTPNVDQIDREGIRFTQHCTSTPVCAPARSMRLTGRYADFTNSHPLICTYRSPYPSFTGDWNRLQAFREFL